MEVILESNCYFLTSLALNESEQCLYTTCAARGELLRCCLNNTTLETLLKVDSAISSMAFTSLTSQVNKSKTNANQTLYLALPQEQSVLKITDTTFNENVTANIDKNAQMSASQHAFKSYCSDVIHVKDISCPSAIALDCTRCHPRYNTQHSCITQEQANHTHIIIASNGSTGESSVVNPCGGLYRLSLGNELHHTQTICANGLALPSAIAVDHEGDIWVCEQSSNRVLRFIERSSHYECVVFAHLAGSQGPSAIAVSPADGTVFVALYEDEQLGSVYKSKQTSTRGVEADSHDDKGTTPYEQEENLLHKREEEEEGEEKDLQMKNGKVLVFASDGTEQGVIVTPGSQLRALAVTRDGSHVYILCSDEVRCSSVIYRCTVKASDELNEVHDNVNNTNNNYNNTN